jgi:hypothetical protein
VRLLDLFLQNGKHFAKISCKTGNAVCPSFSHWNFPNHNLAKPVTVVSVKKMEICCNVGKRPAKSYVNYKKRSESHLMIFSL